jgi:cysteinyl-tRNA synthetase
VLIYKLIKQNLNIKIQENTMQDIYFYNTLGRKLEKFIPIDEKQVTLYTCGPTVYSKAHIGNMRANFFADILNKTLKDAGYNLKHVMNITDVGHLTDDGDDGEDKMLVGMRKEGLTAFQIADKYTEIFNKDITTLNINFADIICKATDYIKEQIELVQTLEAKGFTYITSEGVYFDTSKLKNYGELGMLDIDGLRGGDRVDLGEKKNKTDFSLWKFSPKDEQRAMEWESPWGVGFPGWHAECSAMSMKHLGPTIDIHTGGVDHIQVHHTNEIAQSECATGKKYVNYWMHCEHLGLKDDKMSKSKGTVVYVSSLIEQGIDPLSLRYLFLMSHYRKSMIYSTDIIKDAQTAYLRLNAKVIEINENVAGNTFTQNYATAALKIQDYLYKDLNTAGALAEFRTSLNSNELSNFEKSELVKRFDVIFGLDLGTKKQSNTDIPVEVIALANLRNQARIDKNWAESDRLRDEIKANGYIIKDNSEGFDLDKI